MTAPNGQERRERTVPELLAEIEQMRFEERVREEVERRLAAHAEQQAAQQQPPQVYRSQMTPRAKSDFITEHGREAYEALPWSAEPPALTRDAFGRLRR